MPAVEFKLSVLPLQIGELLLGFAVGKLLTVTLPVISLDVHPLAFLTVIVYEILEPDAPLLRFTVIGVAGKTASVTVVIPVPEIE